MRRHGNRLAAHLNFLVGNNDLVKFVPVTGYGNGSCAKVVHHQNLLRGGFHVPGGHGAVAGDGFLYLTLRKGRVGVAGIGEVAVELEQGPPVGRLLAYRHSVLDDIL